MRKMVLSLFNVFAWLWDMEHVPHGFPERRLEPAATRLLQLNYCWRHAHDSAAAFDASLRWDKRNKENLVSLEQETGNTWGTTVCKLELVGGGAAVVPLLVRGAAIALSTRVAPWNNRVPTREGRREQNVEHDTIRKTRLVAILHDKGTPGASRKGRGKLPTGFTTQTNLSEPLDFGSGCCNLYCRVQSCCYCSEGFRTDVQGGCISNSTERVRSQYYTTCLHT